VIRSETGNLRVSDRCLETSREYPYSRDSEWDRESPCLGSVSGGEPGISVLAGFGVIEELVSVAGNVRSRQRAERIWSRSFSRGPLYTRRAAFVGAGRVRCGRGCPHSASSFAPLFDTAVSR